MIINIREKQEQLAVTIECPAIDRQVERLKKHIEIFDNRILAKKDGNTVNVVTKEVLYFEAVDNRSFLYLKNEVLEVKPRLYELEELLPREDFIRISKSVIVNVNKIKELTPQINRTILVTMCNGEKIYISRKYVADFNRLLSL